MRQPGKSVCQNMILAVYKGGEKRGRGGEQEGGRKIHELIMSISIKPHADGKQKRPCTTITSQQLKVLRTSCRSPSFLATLVNRSPKKLAWTSCLSSGAHASYALDVDLMYRHLFILKIFLFVSERRK